MKKNWLDHPRCYALSQFLLAPGASFFICQALRPVFKQIPVDAMLLDVGCGPASWLHRIGLNPIGLDLSYPYIRRYVQKEGLGILASADCLPFPDGQFDTVSTLFLFHHLPDVTVRSALKEMKRVCRPGGRLIVVDGIFPCSPWLNPFAYAVRRFDRGAHMRREKELQSLLASEADFTYKKVTYTLSGMELLLCQASL